MVAISNDWIDGIPVTADCSINFTVPNTTEIQIPSISFCDWANWFQEKKDMLDFQNELRIDGYRRDLFEEKPLLTQAHVANQFKNYDKRLKVQRNWKNKEVTK